MNNNENNDFANIQPNQTGSNPQPMADPNQNLGSTTSTNDVMGNLNQELNTQAVQPAMDNNVGSIPPTVDNTAPAMMDNTPTTSVPPVMDNNVGSIPPTVDNTVPSMMNNNPTTSVPPAMDNNMGSIPPTMDNTAPSMMNNNPTTSVPPAMDNNMGSIQNTAPSMNNTPNTNIPPMMDNNINMNPVPPQNNNFMNKPSFMSKYGKFIFIGLIVIVLVAVLYLIFGGGKKLVCTKDDDSLGITMSEKWTYKFSSDKAKSVNVIMKLTFTDENKSYKDEMLEYYESSVDTLKDEGAEVDIKSTDTTITITIDAKDDKVSLVSDVNDSTYSNIKSMMEKDEYTCK